MGVISSIIQDVSEDLATRNYEEKLQAESIFCHTCTRRMTHEMIYEYEPERRLFLCLKCRSKQ